MNPKALLIITAMSVETKAVEKLFSKKPKKYLLHKRLGIAALEYKLGSRRMLLAESGVGTVNAALTLSYACDRFPVDGVLLLGVAGALTKTLNIGDLIIPEAILQHDCFFTGGEDEGFMAPGKLYGSLAPQHRVDPKLVANPGLIKWLQKASPDLVTRSFPAGIMLSGNEFVGSSERKQFLARKVPNSIAVEMEAAGVGQVAEKIKLPFVVAKTIADRLSPDGEVITDYKRFIAHAASNSAGIVSDIVKFWTS